MKTSKYTVAVKGASCAILLFITSITYAWEKPYNINKQDDKDKQRWKLNETIQDIYNNLEDLAFRVNNTTYAYIYTHYYSTTSQHELLTNLTYATAGHTGFQADLSTNTWTAYRASTSTYSTDAGNLGMHPPIFFLTPENMIAGVFIDTVRVSTASIVASGTADSSTYLRGDGSWSTPPGTGGGSGLWASVDGHLYPEITTGVDTYWEYVDGQLRPK